MRSIALATLALLACTVNNEQPADDPGMQEVFSDCDPTDPEMCALPFPSTFHMKEDPSTPSGWRIDLGPTALPVNVDGFQPDPELWNERDGWSVLTPALTFMPGATLDGVAGHDNLAASVADDSKTIIVNVDTGERVAHFVELDMSLDDDSRRMLMLRPVEAMDYGGHYVVGIRGITDSAGGTLPASEAFAALRDKASTQDWDVEGRREVFDGVVFPTLAAEGWDRAETQIAWDFVTGSKEGITGRMRHIRDDLLASLPAEGPSYTIDEIEESPNDTTARRVRGTMTVPLYTDKDGPASLLNRDADGMPFASGETEVPFTVIVPNSLWDEGRSGPIIQYGHGLLGDQSEVHASYLSELADEYGYVIIAVDWTGMKQDDAGEITLMLVQDLGKFAIIPERSHQGFAEFLAAAQMMEGALATDDALMSPAGVAGPTSVVDVSRRYYYGNSQGAIMGGALIAFDPGIERATLGVGGAPYNLLLTRSADFEPFFLIFQTMYPDPVEITFWLGMMQTLWDPAEAGGWARTVNEDPIQDTPAKDVLLQVGIGDAQVTTLGAHIMARAYGAKLIEAPVREVYGLETVASGHTGSALVEWDYGIDEPFISVPPSKDTDPHEWVRREVASQQQMHTFFETGEVINYCEGMCQDLERLE